MLRAHNLVIQSYTIVNDINMKFLVVTPPSIYHGCSTRRTFWEEKFTGKKQDLFEPVNMRNFGKRNFRKHREIKDSDERVTLKAYARSA